MTNYDDLLMALDFVSSGEISNSEAYICWETGTIYWISDDLDNADEDPPEDLDNDQKYEAIPHKRDLGLGKQLGLRFTEQNLEEDRFIVEQLFATRGAYSRFKALLQQRGLLEKWYEFETQETRNALLQWCSEVGINCVPQSQ